MALWVCCRHISELPSPRFATIGLPWKPEREVPPMFAIDVANLFGRWPLLEALGSSCASTIESLQQDRLMAQPPSEFGPQAQPQLFSPRQLPLMPAHVSCQDQAGENYGNQGSPQLASATPAPVGTAAHAGAPAIRGVATAASPPPQPPQWLLAPHEGQPAGFQIQELPEAAASKALPASAFGSPRCPYTHKQVRAQAVAQAPARRATNRPAQHSLPVLNCRLVGLRALCLRKGRCPSHPSEIHHPGLQGLRS